MKRPLLLSLLCIISLSLSAQTFSYDVFVQRTYQTENGYSRVYVPYDMAEMSAPNLSRSQQSVSEEIIEVYTWYGEADSFAMATVTDRVSYENYINGSVSRNSPDNLRQDIPWRGPLTYENIAAAFNHGRTEENKQLGNAPAMMTQPTERENQLSLFLANDDRTARGVLPYAGIDAYVTEIAEAHRDDMLANNFFGHTGSDGKSPFRRIDDHPVIGNGRGPGGINCHEFIPRAENLAAFWTSSNSIPLARARSQYNFVYNDASSAWGHRETSLLGERDLRGGKGFTNNHGSIDSEGLVGFALGGSASFNPFNFSWANYGEVFVFNEIDPVPQCDYSDEVVAEFTRFEASLSEPADVKLEWTSPDVSMTNQFDIEQSTDRTNWSLSTTVSVTTATSYVHTLTDLAEGTYYFRIKKVHTDNSSSLSSVKQIVISSDDDDSEDGDDSPEDRGSLQVSIVDNGLVIETNLPLLVSIINSRGQSQNIEYNPGDNIGLSGYSPGVYVVLIRDRDTSEVLRAIRLIIY